MSRVSRECGCERGSDCTLSTVCAVGNAVEEAVEHARDIIEAAQQFKNMVFHGSSRDISQARATLFDAVDRYDDLYADGGE